MGSGNVNLARQLGECIDACNYCFDACLKEEDVKMMAACIRLDKECALICGLTLNSLQANGKFMKDILILCKNACQACADECIRHQNDHCQVCAKVCVACAKACSDFLNENISDGVC